MRDKNVHVKVRARLLDFEMYACKWSAKHSAWHTQCDIVNLSSPSSDIPPSSTELPQWQHSGDITIRRPAVMTVSPKGVDLSQSCTIEYDGGYADKQATAGYVAYLPD